MLLLNVMRDTYILRQKRIVTAKLELIIVVDKKEEKTIYIKSYIKEEKMIL